MRTLLLLGGPPAAGKSTVAPLIADRLAPCAWVEADDLWRISTGEVTERHDEVHIAGRERSENA